MEISRFKGLGEMMPAQLKETTMAPGKRTLLRVAIVEEDREETADSVERLMGTKPEARFAFLQERAAFAAARSGRSMIEGSALASRRLSCMAMALLYDYALGLWWSPATCAPSTVFLATTAGANGPR